VVTHDDGYSLAPGVEVLVLGDAELPSPADADRLTSTAAPPVDYQRVLVFVTEHGPVSTADVARDLRLSVSTVLRALRRLCAEGLLERQGGGRSTRYQRAAP
jgi:uncharacterized membrane protein